jgi:hypothetical protein
MGVEPDTARHASQGNLIRQRILGLGVKLGSPRVNYR